MSIQKLADNLYIAPQLTEADVQEAAKLGIQTVICNRPDGEEENQVTFKQVESWLEAAGIREHHHQPVVAPAINAADVAAFQNLLKSVPQPVLAYCRTGILYVADITVQAAEADTAVLYITDRELFENWLYNDQA